MTVRELAEKHLEIPGVRGVPCERTLMRRLQAAADGRPPPPPAPDRSVGVSVFRPSGGCRAELERALAALAAR